ncbi:MAG: putative Ig domain-containing protein, partial [Fretibacterium sp.]|nr:putative Ig domain-containing protein [Fretibacterium sp.]
TGTPTKSGTFTVTVRAVNAGATVSRALRLVVNAVKPVVSTTSLPTGTIGKSYSATVTVTGNPAPTVTVSGLPAGLKYASGRVTGTPTKSGTFTVTVKAANAGATVTKSLKLLINAVSPVISTSSLAVGTIGKSYSATVTVTGNPTPTVTVSGLPAGLKYASGRITGTPTKSGTFTVTVRAANAGATVTKSLKLLINAVNPVISTSSLAAATIGKSYSATVAVTGNPAPAVTVTGLPAGLSFNASSKRISGTPTKAGTFTVTLRATNAGATASKSLKLVVNAVKPVVSTSSLAAATMGKSYSAAVSITGTPTPTVTVSGLPAGLKYTSGRISGTPTKSGTFTVTVQATNAGGTVTKSLRLTVSAAKVRVAGLDGDDGENEGSEPLTLIPDANQDRADLRCVSGDVVLGVVRAQPDEALAFHVGAWRDIAGNAVMVENLTVCVDGEPVEAEVDEEGLFVLPGFDEDGEYTVSVNADCFGETLRSREVLVVVGASVSLSEAQEEDRSGSGCDAGFGALGYAAVLLVASLGFRRTPRQG